MSGDGDETTGAVATTVTGDEIDPAAPSAWDDLPDAGADPFRAPRAAEDVDPIATPGSAVAARGAERGTRLVHQPALDGLRGLAVAAVVLYHGAAANRIGWLEPRTQGGFLGVSAFFTLSGFLICSLLLAERRERGAVSLGEFWQRRARRLLPAVFLVVAAVTVLTPLLGTASQLEHLPGDVWASLLYVANWRFVAEGADYASQFAGAPSPLKHIWSLSVEEQWYLAVPLAALGAVALRRRTARPDRHRLRRVHLVAALAVASVAGTAWMLWVSGGAWDNRAYMGTDTRLAEMAIGALAAALLGPGLRLNPRARRVVVLLAPLALVVLLAMWSGTDITSSWLFRGGFALHAVAVALVIVAAVQAGGGAPGLDRTQRNPARLVLSVGALCALGRISYGVYLIHWPVLWWVTPSRLGVGPTVAFAVQVGITLVLAVASYRLVELPVRRGGALPGRRGVAVAFASLAAIAVGAAALPEAERSELLALGDTPTLVVPTAPAVASSAPSTSAAATAPPSGGVAPEPTVAAATTVPPAPPPPLRVMVVGDSFAESVVVGLQRWGLLSGHAAVMNQTEVACPFGRGGRNRGISIERPTTPECKARDATLAEAVATFDPEVVLIAGGLWDVTARRPPDFGRWTHIGDPEYDAWLAGELHHLLDVVSAGGARVLWANSPHWDPVPDSVIFMGPPPYVEAQRERVDRFNEVLASVVDPRAGVDVFDLAGWMATHPGGELDPALRPDGVHFSEESTNRVAEWLGPELLRIAASPPSA